MYEKNKILTYKTEIINLIDELNEEIEKSLEHSYQDGYRNKLREIRNPLIQSVLSIEKMQLQRLLE